MRTHKTTTTRDVFITMFLFAHTVARAQSQSKEPLPRSCQLAGNFLRSISESYSATHATTKVTILGPALFSRLHLLFLCLVMCIEGHSALGTAAKTWEATLHHHEKKDAHLATDHLVSLVPLNGVGVDLAPRGRRLTQPKMYKERKSGKCGDSGGGWSKITSNAACGEVVAAVLGWSGTTAITLSC